MFTIIATIGLVIVIALITILKIIKTKIKKFREKLTLREY